MLVTHSLLPFALNMQKIQDTADGGNAYAEGDYSYAEGGDAGDSSRGIGGDGGHAHAVTAYSKAIGGRGGRGGIGKGGPGGNAMALQDGVACYGGNGGESAQHDGRGGRGGTPQMMRTFLDAELIRRAAMKLPYGTPNTFPGRGGDSPDEPQYMARRLIVEQIKSSYFIEHGIPTEGAIMQSGNMLMLPDDWLQTLTARYSDVWYDRNIVPLKWINEQVQRSGNMWTVEVEAEEYVFADNNGTV
jgi:hypothetical protein